MDTKRMLFDMLGYFIIWMTILITCEEGTPDLFEPIWWGMTLGVTAGVIIVKSLGMQPPEK